jgi:adenine phosphoribosyltransferase
MTDRSATPAEILAAIRDIPNFPKPGIHFKDITPVLADGRLFAATIDHLLAGFKPGDIDVVVGIDARGFIFAGAAALRLGCGFVPVRKKGKLPFDTYEASYDLEYGSNTIAMHIDAVKPGCRVALIDDVLATGGTAAAAVELLKRGGAVIVEVGFVIELGFLNGRSKLGDVPVRSVVTY